jgi:hypothetical protein
MKAAHGVQRRDVIGAPAGGEVRARLYRLAYLKQIARSNDDIFRLYNSAS